VRLLKKTDHAVIPATGGQPRVNNAAMIRCSKDMSTENLLAQTRKERGEKSENTAPDGIDVKELFTLRDY